MVFARWELSEGDSGRMGRGGGLLAGAWLAHLLPVLWSVGVLAYMWMARRPAMAEHALFFVGYVVILLAVHVVVPQMCPESSQRGWLRASGTDHAWIFGDKSYLTLAGRLFCWVALFGLDFSSCRGFRQ